MQGREILCDMDRKESNVVLGSVGH
jgi:hypothetical protein